MRTINTANLELSSLSIDEKLWVYNGFDDMVTKQILPAIQDNCNADVLRVYNFEKALMGPVMAMSDKGMLIDLPLRDDMLSEVWRKIHSLTGMDKVMRKKQKKWKVVDPNAPMQRLAYAFWDKEFNPFSSIEFKKFFYKAMKIPFVWKFEKGKKIIATDREALERIMFRYPRARPIGKLVLMLRDLKKQLDVLEAKLDDEGRMHFSFNIAGTESGRFSSNKDIYGRGTNGQNITDFLRRIFIADPGYVLVYPDLEQAEARVVAGLSRDAAFIEAVSTGDIHTSVAKLVWPDLGWTGDAKGDRKIADQKYYRDFSYRDMAKKAGHGSNYGGTP